MLETVVIEPVGVHRASVIWLHGLGADGHDFEPIAPQLGLPAEAGVRFVFPHAPVRPVTINAGVAMRAWYDVAGLHADSREDAAGLAASASAIEALIAGETASGVAPRHIVLAGFSQGGALALHTGLHHREPLGGLIGLSTYLPQRAALHMTPAANRAVPIFMAHGSTDPVLPHALGEASRDLLRNAGYAVAWHSYPVAHQLCREEIQALGAWLRERLCDG